MVVLLGLRLRQMVGARVGDACGRFGRGGDIGHRRRRLGEDSVVLLACGVQPFQRPVGGGDLGGDEGLVVLVGFARTDPPQHVQQRSDHAFQVRGLRFLYQPDSGRTGAHEGHGQAKVFGQPDQAFAADGFCIFGDRFGRHRPGGAIVTARAELAEGRVIHGHGVLAFSSCVFVSGGFATVADESGDRRRNLAINPPRANSFSDNPASANNGLV
jgi:hypothetical protein